MKALLTFFIALLSLNIAQAQKGTIASKILEIVVKDDGVFRYANTRQKIVLIDTFQFFSTYCSGVYAGKQIEILNTMPDRKSMNENTFIVGWVSTGKENFLEITFIQLATNEIGAYFFSLLGRKIKIVKTSFSEL